MTNKKLAAVFIDFENFYFSLTNLYEMTHQDAGEVAVSLIASQLEKLIAKQGEFIIRQAFADWSQFPGPKRELQRIGIRIVDVLSTEYKNSADIELSLAVQEIMITRPEIEVIVIFAGDRDYMPIALRARERGRGLFFVGFEKSLSGDVKSLVGSSNYSYVALEEFSGNKGPSNDLSEFDSKESLKTIEGLTQDEQKAAIAAVQAFDQYEVRFGCVKVSVFLVEGLANALPNVEHFRRKRIFSSLVEKRIVLTEQRMPDVPDPNLGSFPYTVFVINDEHEAVIAIRNSTKSVSQKGRDLLEEAAFMAADSNKTVLGANLGNVLKKLDPTFSPLKYGFNGLTEFIEQYPEILQYDGAKSGGDRKYRLTAKKS